MVLVFFVLGVVFCVACFCFSIVFLVFVLVVVLLCPGFRSLFGFVLVLLLLALGSLHFVGGS